MSKLVSETGMAATNYTLVDPNAAYLNKSAEINSGLENNLVLLTALLTFVRGSLLPESHVKQLIISQAHHRVEQAVSLLSECEYSSAQALVRTNRTNSTLSSFDYTLIRQVIERGPAIPAVSEELSANITLLVREHEARRAVLYTVTLVERTQALVVIYCVTLFLLSLVIIRLHSARKQDQDRTIAYIKQARSDNNWVSKVENNVQRFTQTAKRMEDTHRQIGQLLTNYQRFFAESSQKLSEIDCRAVESTATATRDGHIQTISTLIRMIDSITEHRSSLQRAFEEISRSLPGLGKFGKLLAERAAIGQQPDQGDDDDGSSIAEVPPIMPLLTGSMTTVSGSRDMGEVWAAGSNPWLRPPITPLPTNFDASNFHEIGQKARNESHYVSQMTNAERHELTGTGRRALDLCGRAIWRGIAETSTLTLKPLELRSTTIGLLRNFRDIFTTDQDTQCPHQHLPDNVCEYCLKRVLCSYSCLVCELSITMLAEWYGIEMDSLDPPSVIHDVAYHQQILQGKPPSRSRALYPYERGEMGYGDKAGARSRIYEPVNEVMSNSALTMYNLYRFCEECNDRHPVVSRKKDALRLQELSYHTWFARHYQDSLYQDGWDPVNHRQIGSPLPLGQCHNYNGDGGINQTVRNYHLATGEVATATAPFTDQLLDHHQDNSEDLTQCEGSSLIQHNQTSLIATPTEVFELPGEVKARMSLRNKIEAILETTL